MTSRNIWPSIPDRALANVRLTKRKLVHAALLFAALLLSACGGGEGSGQSAATNPSLAASTSTPRYFAYVINQDNVLAYSINANTGALTALGIPVAAGTIPISIAVDPSGKFAYVANNRSNDVSAFTINPTTGALTAVGASVPAGTNPVAVVVHPSGKFAYEANINSNDVSAYTINATTGALTAMGAALKLGVGWRPLSLAVVPSGKFAYVTIDPLNIVTPLSIDAQTGALSLAVSAQSVGVDKFPNSITVDPMGKFAFVLNGLQAGIVSAYTINDRTGALTSVGAPVAAGLGPSSIMIGRSSKFVYVTSTANLTPAILSYTMDAATGALTSMGAPLAAEGSVPNCITADPTDRFAYVVNMGIGSGGTVSAYTINRVTGALTPVAAPVPAGINPVCIAIARTIA
ncbi:MAG: beta-propeller fold lactonase family protein [Betaproteobacteria bacterium]